MLLPFAFLWQGTDERQKGHHGAGARPESSQQCYRRGEWADLSFNSPLSVSQVISLSDRGTCVFAVL